MSMHPMTDQCSICFSRSAPRHESGNWSVGGHLASDHRSPFWVICPLTSLPPDLSMVTRLLTPDHRSRRSSPWSLCHLVHVSPCEWSTWSSAADVIDYRWPIGSWMISNISEISTTHPLKISLFLCLQISLTTTIEIVPQTSLTNPNALYILNCKKWS